MNIKPVRVARLTLWAALACLPAAMLSAQDPFDFGGAPPPAPAAADATPRPASARTGDVVIDTIVASKPTTPRELLRAVQVLRDYGATTEASGYLKQLAAAGADASTLASLVEEFGEGLMFRLVNDRRLQPEGEQFGLAALAAYRDYVRNPQRLGELVRALSSPSATRRLAAAADLRKAHDAAIDAMMGVLADAGRASEHAAVREALIAIEPPALEMTLAALRSSNDTLRRNAIQIISRLGDQRAAAYLIEPYLDQANDATIRRAAAAALARFEGELPSRGQALEFLDRAARRFELGGLVQASDDADHVPHWQWIDAENSFRRTELRFDDASLAAAADLTGALYRLAPERVEYRRRYLLAELTRAKLLGGYDQPITETQPALAEQLADVGIDAIDDALQIALRDDRLAAAAAAAEVLGHFGHVGLLDSPAGRPRPLAEALSHGDRRVRFAAASAIAQLAPRESYAGASRFAEAAAHFIATQDRRAAVVCEPREQRTHRIAGLLGHLEVEGVATYTGIAAWKAAAASPDVEFVLLSWAIDRPNLNETLQMFRTDKRTARLPIALMTDEAHHLALSRLAADDPLTMVTPYPHEANSLAILANRLESLLDRERVDQQQRVLQAKAALGWFQAVAEAPEIHPDHDLSRHYAAVEQALYVPALSQPAAKVLAALATPDAQAALAHFASQNTRPLAQRQTAAAAFAEAVERRGVQLTNAAILRQYDRYNDSAALPVETQQVLGSILDAIEAPSRAEADAADPPSAADSPDLSTTPVQTR